MPDLAKLGTRFTCFACGTKFYDLHREKAVCPECGADQSEAPAKDVKALLKGSGRPRPSTSDSVPTSVDADDVSDDDEFDDLGLDDDEDEDEDVDDEDDDDED
jgi:predicted  nucleic acid-binding Zn-ribbon protein